MRYALSMRQAVREMNKDDYSLRDIGEVLGISHQRAQQLSRSFKVDDIAADVEQPASELRRLVREEYARLFPSHVPSGDWESVDDRMARWLYERFGHEVPADDTDRRANDVQRARAAKKVRKR
jgi:hypothetical protein